VPDLDRLDLGQKDPQHALLEEAVAQRRAVVWMVLRRVLLLAAVGLAISVPAALTASQLVKSFLFQAQPNDPATLLMAGIVLAGQTKEFASEDMGPARSRDDGVEGVLDQLAG
jgi:hypothetical protein